MIKLIFTLLITLLVLLAVLHKIPTYARVCFMNKELISQFDNWSKLYNSLNKKWQELN